MAKKAHKSFAKLTAWQAVSFEDADERFAFADVNEDLAIEDLFGDEPEHVFVHEGQVTIDGDAAIGASGDYAGVYVIDGSLEVSGLLDFVQIDGAAILYVTGDVKAKNLSVAQEAQLWVGGALTVDEHLLGGMSDAGGLLVKGATTAKVLIATDSDMFSFGKKPKARIIERYEGLLDEDDFPKRETTEDALAAPFNTEEIEHEDMVKALKKGKKLLK